MEGVRGGGYDDKDGVPVLGGGPGVILVICVDLGGSGCEGGGTLGVLGGGGGGSPDGKLGARADQETGGGGKGGVFCAFTPLETGTRLDGGGVPGGGER